MTKDEWYRQLFERLDNSKFRSSFHLKQKDIDYINQKGLDTIRQHAKDFIAKREAPAFIANDGKQTPMKGHPVFIAQHATATCCRECIRKWHKMQPGRELSQVQQDYLVDIIMTWIQKRTGKAEKEIMKMQIFVDADACPVVGIVEEIAKKYSIPATLLCDTNHVLYSDYSEVIVVGAGADAVDYKLISICHKGDVVVSQDYGVAAMALGKEAYAIHQSGKWYTNENIDQMLMERHLNKKARRSSHKNYMKDQESVQRKMMYALRSLLKNSYRWQNQKKVLRVGLFKKKTVIKTYDKENKKPVIKASICNGEQVAGFKDIHTGKIEEVMLIKSQADLDEFKKMYGIDGEIEKETSYEKSTIN